MHELSKNLKEVKSRKRQRLFYEVSAFKNKISINDKSKELVHFLQAMKVQKEAFFVHLKVPRLLMPESLGGRLEEAKRKLANHEASLNTGFSREIKFQRIKFFNELKSLQKLKPVVKKDALRVAAESIKTQSRMKLTVKRSFLLNLETKISAFDPNRLLQMGYAIVRRDNKVVKRGKELKEGQEFQVLFSDGAINARVERKTSTSS